MRLFNLLIHTARNRQGTRADDVLVEVAPLPAEAVFAPIAAINHVTTGRSDAGDRVMMSRGAHITRAGASGTAVATAAADAPIAPAVGDTTNVTAPGLADTPTNVPGTVNDVGIAAEGAPTAPPPPVEMEMYIPQRWSAEELQNGDRAMQDITPADVKLIEVYGDSIHQNDGTHLDGGIGEAKDQKWQ